MSKAPETLSKLRRLTQCWEQRYPERAAGGVLAVAGFRYQFLVALRALLDNWQAKTDGEKARPHVLVESLSDVTQIDDQVVLVNQVKRTSTGRTVSKGLDELWSISEVAHDTTPDLVDQLRFRLVAARSKLVDVETLLDRWRPATEIPDHESRLEKFKAAVEVTIEANPEDEILAFLVNELQAADPLGLIYRWLGLLYEAAEEPTGFDRALRDVWNDLQGLRRAKDRKPGGLYSWTAEDQPPEEVHPGEYLTGQQPRVHHLRNGFFAQRPKVYSDLFREATDWIAQRSIDSNNLKVPIFWVGGRSGSGKSVALLHLLAALHADGLGPVFWLGNRVDALPEVLAWAKDLRRSGKQILIGVDDPYAPIEQVDAKSLWSQVLTELQDARESGESEEIPGILACGPSEQAELLADQLRRDVAVTTYELPKVSVESLEPLRKWFFRRSGVPASKLSNENVLLVQLFFEWQTGRTLDDFAINLRNRLVAGDPSEALLRSVSLLLAANRLYVGLPNGALEAGLSTPQLEFLDTLRHEEHIATDPEGRGGEWLSHPHLANIIYEVWYPVRKRRQRYAHLAEAIQRSIENGPSSRDKMAILNAILQTLTDKTGPLLERLEPELAKRLLRDTYVQYTAAGFVPPDQLPFWLDVVSSLTEWNLAIDPVAEALGLLSPDSLGLPEMRPICLKLVYLLDSAAPSRRLLQIEEALTSFLQNSEVWSWGGWQIVMTGLLKRAARPSHWQLVADWCQENGASSRLLIAALDSSEGDEKLRSLANEALEGAPGTTGWGDLARNLLHHSETIPPGVESWIERFSTIFVAVFALHEVLTRHSEVGRAWAEKWVRVWFRERSANYLLEPLCKLEDKSPELFEWCRQWLSEGHPNSSFLMQRFLEAFEDRPDSLEVASRWLKENPSDKGWSFVWTDLWDERGEYLVDEATLSGRELLNLGLRWLALRAHGRAAWFQVWNRLVTEVSRGYLHKWSSSWLEAAPLSSPTWSFTWEASWSLSPGSPGLVTKGKSWLTQSPCGHGSWLAVWGLLLEHDPDDESLWQFGYRYLESTAPEEGTWMVCFRKLRALALDDSPLLDLGLGSLGSIPQNTPLWSSRWLELRRLYKKDESLYRMGVDCLRQNLDNDEAWSRLWGPLWGLSRTRDRAALIQLGISWIEAASIEHPTFPKVLEALWSEVPGEPTLYAKVIRCLKQNDTLHQQHWCTLWKKLWDFNPDDTLTQLGLNWLGRKLWAVPNWFQLWELLWESGRESMPLVDLAIERLEYSLSTNHWSKVWLSVWAFDVQRPTLERLGGQWLAKMHGSGNWPLIFVELWKESPTSELRALAEQWLWSNPNGHNAKGVRVAIHDPELLGPPTETRTD